MTGSYLDLSTITSLAGLIDRGLRRFGPNVALIEADRDRPATTYTYDEFYHVARKVAGILATTIAPGDHAAILMSNQSRWLFCASAIFFRGGVLVPLDYKLLPSDQLALLSHSEAKVVFVEWPLYQRWIKEGFSIPSHVRMIVTDAPAKQTIEHERFEVLFESAPLTEVDLTSRGRSDIACIVYSSGTSGTPKGCMLTHENYLAQAEMLGNLFPIEPHHRYFSVLPTNHAIDFMCGFLLPLQFGSAVVHQRTLRPEYLASTMKSHRVSHMALVPLLLRAFEKKIKDGIDAQSAFKRRIIRALMRFNAWATRSRPRPWLSRMLFRPIHEAFGGSLELLFAGGAFVDRALAEFFHAVGLPVVIGYGLSEAGTVLTVNDLHPFRSDTVGRPVPRTRIEIRNPNDQGVGEVYAKGPTVMAGYFRSDELTKEALCDGWLRTGDLGYLDSDGHLILVGRSKNMIVTEGGKNIYPEDVESAFEGAIEDTEWCVYSTNYVWPASSLAGEKLLLVVHPKQTLDSATVLLRLSERNRQLADYKRVGKVLLWDQDFPRTASMKIKRQELATVLAKVPVERMVDLA